MTKERRDRTKDSLAIYYEPINRIASTLLGDVAKISPGQMVLLWYDTPASPLIESMERECLKNQVIISRFRHDLPSYVDFLKKGHIKKVAKIFKKAKGLVEEADYVLIVRANDDPKIFAELEPMNLQLYNTIYGDALNGIDARQNGWTFITWPTKDEARRARLDYKTFLGMYLKGCDQNWSEIAKAHEVLKRKLAMARLMHVIGQGTDLSIRLSEDKEITSSTIGQNFPGSEVSFAPEADSINGTLFSPGERVLNGKVVRNVTLIIKDGKIVSSDATEGASDLEALLDSHPGYRYFGDVIFGTNSGVSHLLGNHMLDLKTAGNVSFYIGRTDHDASDPGNELTTPKHYNLTLSTRSGEGGGQILLDGLSLQENGVYCDSDLSVISVS